ncbi:MAG: type I-C CRISPR-associated protein Cas7/Csd2 [Desulfovibrio sp.]|nr:type I-C CRISPR-associated protein Cas7/Csd2 [Desulfovibrio sp.]
MSEQNPLNNRYDFVLFFDVENGNPNGDPDAGNMPRIDPETGHGIVSDVCLKRKVRNFVELAQDEMEKEKDKGYRIYVQEKAVLNDRHAEAYTALNIPIPNKNDKKGEKDGDKADKKAVLKEEEARALNRWMCDNFYDIRTFGAVMSTKVDCGQVRGPVQFTFARSEDPVVPAEISITRMAVTRQEEAEKGNDRTMGRKHIVPYGLYRMEGFISAPLAEKSGFTEGDAEILWRALAEMFEHDHSAARGKMGTRKLYVFRHDKRLGNAPAQKLFDLVRCRRPEPDTPPRSFADYEVTVNKAGLPEGVELIEKL